MSPVMSAVIQSSISWIVGFLMGTVVLGNLRRLLKRNAATQEKIADQLDTSTPGGLTDVLTALEHEQMP